MRTHAKSLWMVSLLVLVAVWAPDAAYESGDLAAPGPRHRLVMDDAGWRYQRSD